MNISSIALRLTYTLAILPLVWLPVSAMAETARNVDQLAEQIRETNQQLEALRNSIEQNTSLKQDLQAEYEIARQKRDERDVRLTELSGRIAQFDQQLRTLEQSLQEANETVAQRKSLLARSLSISQSIGHHNKIKTLLQHDEPAKAQRLATYRGYVFKAHEQQLGLAIDYLEEVEKAQISALKDRNWLNYIKNKATGQRETYARNEQSTQNQLRSVNESLSESTRTVAQLKQDQQRLQSLLAELEDMQRGSSGYFAARQGKLPFPVLGRITAQFGDTKSVGKLRWQGIFIEADAGSPVKVVADGEVVYSDWLQGFGMLVVVDHGDSYMTLYAGNRSLIAVAGSWVETGATIAMVGDAAGQNDNGLYFEIRHNATALDPTGWISVPASAL